MIRSSSIAIQGWKRPALLALLGCMCLSVGLLVYLADRRPSAAPLVPAIAALGGRNVFGALGQWLPSFAHPLAFSLFTAAALRPGMAACWGACAFWGGVNVAFEVGQHPALASAWSAALHGGAGDWAIARHLVNYFLRGTFDPYDLCAATLGALAGGGLLQCTHHFRQRRRDCQ